MKKPFEIYNCQTKFSQVECNCVTDSQTALILKHSCPMGDGLHTLALVLWGYEGTFFVSLCFSNFCLTAFLFCLDYVFLKKGHELWG